MKEIVAPVQSFGNFVKTRRLQLDLTQGEVAERVGITQGCLSKVENGVQEPTIVLALKICKALNLNINDFARDYI